MLQNKSLCHNSILLLLGLFLLGSAGCSSDEPSKTPAAPNVSTQVAVVSVSANDICADYQNTIAGDKKYKDKVIAVSGKVVDVTKDFGEILVNLDGGGPAVHCIFSSAEESKLASVQVGQMISVKGQCTGESLGSPKLNDCILQ